jgi:2-keto-4-pentenoate hydratase
MTNPQIDVIAQTLLTARRTQTPADASPFAGQLHSVSEALAVQDIILAALAPQQTPISRHWKSGGPSRTAEILNTALLDTGMLKSPAQASAHPFNLRLIEIEIGFKTKHAVTPAQASAMTQEQGHALIEAFTVTIEVVDSRWQQGIDTEALLKLADMQSHGVLVIGQWQPYGEQEARRNWSKQRCTVKIGEQAPLEFVGTHSMQDPRWVIPAWVQHATSGGQTLPAGAVVTTGSWSGVPAAQAGELVVAQFDGIGSVSVQL